MGLGIKQKALIEIGAENGKLTTADIKVWYPQKAYVVSTMAMLERMGYFRKELKNNSYVWIYIGPRE